MEIIGILGVLLAVVIVIYGALEGVTILILAPLSAVIIMVTNQMDIVESLLGINDASYMVALSNYIRNYFMVFLLGAILARLMESSGATTSIAEGVLKIIGTNNPYRILLAVFIIGFILTYGGISLFVVMFALIPLAKSLFKKANISWHLIQVPLWLGTATITMTMLPGTPSIQNVIPITTLHTSLTAAFIPSLVGSMGCLIFGLWYMKWTLKKSLSNNETFNTYLTKELEEESIKDTPPFSLSILPLIVLIILALSGSLFGDSFIKANIIYIALGIANLLAFILFYKYLDNPIKVINRGALDSLTPVFVTSSTVAFGSIVMASNGFSLFNEMILNMPGGPSASLSTLTALMSGITASSSGAVGIVIPKFAQFYLSLGMNPEMIHRITAVASNITTFAPQSGVLLTFYLLTGLNYKNSYKETLVLTFIGSLIALILIIVVGHFIY